MSTYTPEQFGAVGDGVAYDQPAFDRLNAALAASGGGVVQLAQDRVYLCGRQVPGGGGIYQGGTNIIHVENAKALIIHGNGATIRFKGDMKFGAFDPATGLASDEVSFIPRGTKRADIGIAVFVTRTPFVRIYNLKVDGNSAAQVIGGRYSDTGWQCTHDGVNVANCANVHLDGVEVSNVLGDGGVQAAYGMNPSIDPAPFTMENCRFLNCGRNCFSQLASNQTVVLNCSFLRPGQAPIAGGGVLGSEPRSGYDIEAEGGTNRNTRFILSVFDGRGGSTGFVADSGDSADISFDGCTVIGGYWAGKPNISFRGGRISGVVAKMFSGQADPKNNAHLIDVDVDDAAATPGDEFLFQGQGYGPRGYVIDRCRIRVTKTRLDFTNATIKDTEVRIETGTNRLLDFGVVMGLNGVKIRGMEVTEAIPVGFQPANAFHISHDLRPDIEDAFLSSPSGKVKWTTPNADGSTGRLSFTAPRGGWLEINRDVNYLLGGQTLVFSMPTMPTAGVFERDWIVLAQNVTRQAGYVLLGWRRLTTGPGHVLNTDWQEMWISGTPRRAAAVADLAASATLADVIAAFNQARATERAADIRAT